MKTIEKKIEENKEELKRLEQQLNKEKQSKEKSKISWLKIPELEIEIQTKIHHKDKTLSECEKDLEEGESIPTYEQLQFLRNSDKYRDKLNLLDTWEFVQNPDKISKKNGYVARFIVYSGFCLLGLWLGFFLFEF